MRYSGIQPQYFPRLHYFARLLDTDVFVLRDDVQYVRKHKYPNGKNDKSYQADTPIKASHGRHLLSIPIRDEGYSKLTETHLSEDIDWASDHLMTIQYAYSHSPNFAHLFPEITSILTMKHESLPALTITTFTWGLLHLMDLKITDVSAQCTIEYLAEILMNQKTIRPKLVSRASQSHAVQKLKEPSADQKILALIKEAGADEDFCGGTAHAAYMDEALYKKHGIRIVVQDWTCQEYPQLFGHQHGFIPNLSIIDLLMNVTPEEARNILTG